MTKIVFLLTLLILTGCSYDKITEGEMKIVHIKISSMPKPVVVPPETKQ